MDKVIEIAKIVTIIQIVIVLLFILLMFVARYFLQYRERKNAKKMIKISHLFSSYFEEEKVFTPEECRYLQRQIQHVMTVLSSFEDKHINADYLGAFNAQLSNLVLKPVARKYASSYDWFKRYCATQCYAYGFEKEDEEKLLLLIQDKALLVAINAVTVAVNYANPVLINQMITVFSESRRLRQTSFAEIIAKGQPDIALIIQKRLEQESNLYVKLFCYRLLYRLPVSKIAACVKTDIKIDSVDLKIAVLHYLVHCQDKIKNELIYSLANDPNWEVRAVVAKALGTTDDRMQAANVLEVLLHDAEWWVRVNAANSLSELGKSGIDILKNQSLKQDKFAYETAQVVLAAREEK